MSVSHDNGFISINNSRIFLMCGEIHYFRVPKDLWLDRLLKIKRANLNCVSSYIPWNWHQLDENSVFFADDFSPSNSYYESKLFSRNLEKYIDIVKELNMFFIARPGPYICSEWDSGGHPGWLYKKTKMLRSLDRNYIEAVEKWYNSILSIISKHTIAKKSAIILLQIENEYFWGDVPYIMRLYEIARKYVNDIPIIINEDWFVENTPVANTIDDYPVPWDIKNFDRKIKEYMKTQPNMLKMFMELEGGWFTCFGSILPTSRGSFPAEWTEILIKTAIGLGINGINIYMFHGGTNPGYYTGKYITSSYDYEAPIREWGELSSRYYALKRIAMFVTSFNNLLTRTKSVEKIVDVSNKEIEVFTRVSEDYEAIVILRNLDIYPKLTRVMYKNNVYPYTSVIRIPHRNAKIILLNVKIDNTPFKIIYTSSEPLLMKKIGNEVVLVVYGDIHEIGEICLSSEKSLEIIYSENMIIEKKSSEEIILKYVHGFKESIAILNSNNTTFYIIAISRDKASRTWYIDNVQPPIVIISNLYFVGLVKNKEKFIDVDVEIDEQSCGYVLLFSPKPISRVYIDNKNIKIDHVYGALYRFYVDTCRNVAPVEISIENVWKINEENTANLHCREIEPKKPLELLDYIDNGYYIYTIEFNLNEEILKSLKNFKMFISHFNDYATIILNEKPLASGYHTLEIDVSNMLNKNNTNKLTIILESMGRPSDGLVYTPNGVVGDIYIGKIDELMLDEWKYLDISTKLGKEFSMSELVNTGKYVEEIIKNINIETMKITHSINKEGLYLKTITIDKKIGRYVLDLGKAIHYGNYFYYPRALLFINKKFIGTYIGPIDITEHLVEGVNEIIVYVDWSRIALHPVLKIYQFTITATWRICRREGLEKKWYSENIDESSWKQTSFPLIFSNEQGKLVWIRNKVYIDRREDVVAPLKLVIEAEGIKALLFFNGQFIGRYVEEGPQNEFYIPESLVKNVNTLALALHVVNDRAVIKNISIQPYYIHRKMSMRFNLESKFK